MFCEWSFIQSFHLTIHNLNHAREKPFMCILCEKAFRQSSHLVTHKLSHT